MFTFILTTLIACREDHSVDPYSPRYFIAENKKIVEGKACTTQPASAVEIIGVEYTAVCRFSKEN